jgi:uncharacterized protein (TIGR02453 family)
MKEIYQFLTELEVNNNKVWFDANRERYQETRQKFLHLTDVLINEIRSFDQQIGYPESKDCMFRVFRDVRFSNDKRPFKSNYGSFIAKGGRSNGNPGYYLHIQPGQSFLGGGVYMPQPDMLKSIRDAIYTHPDSFLEIIEDEPFKKTFTLYDEDRLKTAPKGYPKEWEHIGLLRYKSYSPWCPVSEEELFSPDLIEMVVEKFRLMHPFNQFLYESIGEMR